MTTNNTAETEHEQLLENRAARDARISQTTHRNLLLAATDYAMYENEYWKLSRLDKRTSEQHQWATKRLNAIHELTMAAIAHTTALTAHTKAEVALNEYRQRM